MDVTVTINYKTQKQPRYIGWRCLHEAEGGYNSDDRGMPEIRPALPNPLPVIFTRDLQWLSWNFNTYNPDFTKGNWRTVFGFTTAFTNGNGFNNPNDPRRDYVNGLNLDAPYPKLMKALICGGMFIRGEVRGDNLHCIPGVHAIDANKPIPTIDVVREKNWYFVATTQYYGKVSNFPQGHGRHVYIPYALREEVTYPIAWFTEWAEDYLPDPLKIYLT